MPLVIFSSLFRSECKLILYLTTMYVYCVYPAISKSSKQLPNCLKITETSVVLIIFICVICDVRTYTVTVSFCCSTWIRYQKYFIPWPNNTEVYLTPLIVLNITQLQDIYLCNLFLLASKQEWTALQRLVFLTVSNIRLLQINFICSNNVHNCLCSMGVLRFVYLRELYLCSPLLLTSVYVWFVWMEGHLMNINGFKQMNLLYFL